MQTLLCCFSDSHSSKPTNNNSKPKTKIFGEPLEHAIKLSNPNGKIPLVLQQSIQYLNEKGLDTVGLYRVSGSVLQVNEYAETFDRLEVVNFFDVGHDPHDVAGLVRKYMKDLPEPIFSEEHAQKFVLHQVPKELRAYRVFESLREIPVNNRETIRALVHHWKLLTDNSAVNNMTISTLMKSIFSMSPYALAYHVMIEDYDQIFVDYSETTDQ